MLIRDWAIAFLVLGLVVTLFGVTGMGGAWTFVAIAVFIVISGVMLVVDSARTRKSDLTHS